MEDILSVSEITRIILASTIDHGVEEVPLARAAGRVLRENLFADRDLPPFDRVAMDGIAVPYAALAEGRMAFPVEGIQAAGQAPLHLHSPEKCIEVMTGAVLPHGTDTVIRYEDIGIKDGVAALKTRHIRKGQNVHKRAGDLSRDTVVAHAGTLLSPAETGIAATIGKAVLKVARLPKAILASTGDELVGVEDMPLAHQIRASHGSALPPLFAPLGMDMDLSRLPDEPRRTREALRQMLRDYELVILTGGISRGKFDFVPESLDSLGVRILCRRVAQRPGKPFLYGTLDQRRVFALPGNPASALVGALRYLRPWLRASLGLPPFSAARAFLTETVNTPKPLTHFIPVALHWGKKGRLLATPNPGKGSGDLANLTRVGAFVEVPPEIEATSPDVAYPFFAFRETG